MAMSHQQFANHSAQSRETALQLIGCVANRLFPPSCGRLRASDPASLLTSENNRNTTGCFKRVICNTSLRSPCQPNTRVHI
jgi:hypothetical protein